MKKIIRALLILFFSVFFALLASEIFLRVFWHPPKLDPDYRRDDLKWLKENVVLNRFNYRDREFTLKKDPNIFRVYSLGDSFTFGWYINDAALNYPKILEKKLQEEFGKDKIEVINASRHGFSFAQDLERLVNEGALFNPDLVTIGITAYDLVDINYPKPLIKNNFIRSLKLYQITLGKVEEERISRAVSRTMELTFKDNSPQMEGIERLFKSFKEEASSLKAEAVIVLFPEYSASNPNGPYLLSNYYPKIAQAAQKYSIKLIDLMEPFSRYPDKRDLILSPVDPHPSAKAHQMAADFIFQQLDWEKFLRERKPPLNSLEATITPETELPGYKGIISLGEIGWVYSDDLGGNVKKIFLPDSGDRKIAYLDHYLETVKPFISEGWPGAKITYYAPVEGGKANFSRKLFGYPVVGVAAVRAYWREDGALMSDELDFGQVKISRDDNQVYLETDSIKPWDYFKVTVDIAVNQINIKENHISDFTRTNILTSKLKKDQSDMSFLLTNRFGSLPNFSSYGKSQNYAWINNKLTPVYLDKKDFQLLVGFYNRPPEYSEVEIPILGEVSGTSLTYPKVEYLSN